ncbi:MAG: putative ABC transporter phosphonate/phosphite binding protein PhnD2 [Verrucomicrobiae bacterium]|nr:putative ABC transporter phosphonate/phosphite binding protein PhnD2 [Verrucomicrobiae bacterium]
MRTLFFLLLASVAYADPATLVVAFQPQENPEKLQLNAKTMTEFLAKELAMPVKIHLPTDYAAVVEALRAGHAHVAYFSAWPYLLAHKLAGVEIIVAEERAGQTFYHSQWYALKAGTVHSLKDAKGKPAAFTAPSSTSGYLFPLAKLVDDGLLPARGDPATYFGKVLFAGGYEQALKALVNGQVELAAASDYAFARYLTPDEQTKVEVISRQGPVPTHCVAVKNTLSPELRAKVQAALLKLNDNKELLKTVYGAEKFVAVTHTQHVSALAHALEVTGLDYPLKKK